MTLRLPSFTDEERCIYFDLSPAEHDAVDAVHTDAAAVHMVLQLGYFKAKRQVFIYEPETVCDDLRHIMKRYFPGMDNVPIKGDGKDSSVSLVRTAKRGPTCAIPAGDRMICVLYLGHAERQRYRLSPS